MLIIYELKKQRFYPECNLKCTSISVGFSSLHVRILLQGSVQKRHKTSSPYSEQQVFSSAGSLLSEKNEKGKMKNSYCTVAVHRFNEWRFKEQEI